MEPSAQSSALIFGWLGIGAVMLLGLGLLYARATNIERPILVGGLTLLGGLVSAGVMERTVMLGGPYSWAHTFGIVLIGVLFFAWGWFADYAMGQPRIDPEADEATLGAHVSD